MMIQSEGVYIQHLVVHAVPRTLTGGLCSVQACTKKLDTATTVRFQGI